MTTPFRPERNHPSGERQIDSASPSMRGAQISVSPTQKWGLLAGRPPLQFTNGEVEQADQVLGVVRILGVARLLVVRYLKSSSLSRRTGSGNTGTARGTRHKVSGGSTGSR